MPSGIRAADIAISGRLDSPKNCCLKKMAATAKRRNPAADWKRAASEATPSILREGMIPCETKQTFV